MANWIKCTTENGDKVLLNFDYAVALLRNDHAGVTYIKMVGDQGDRTVKETIDELSKLGAKL